jgi:hypothetical protein
MAIASDRDTESVSTAGLREEVQGIRFNGVISLCHFIFSCRFFCGYILLYPDYVKVGKNLNPLEGG